LLKIIAQSVTLSDKDKELCGQYFEPVLFPKLTLHKAVLPQQITDDFKKAVAKNMEDQYQKHLRLVHRTAYTSLWTSNT